MTAEQFLAELVALVPPPYFNLVRYAGVFHNRHRWTYTGRPLQT